MRVFRAAVFAVMSVARTGAADKVDSEMFRPTPAIAADGFELEPAEVGRDGEWIVTAVVGYVSNPMAVETSLAGTPVASDRPITRRAMFELGGAYAFLDRYEVGLSIPMYDQSGDAPDLSAFHVPAAHDAALGDLALHGRARLYDTALWTFAGALHVTLPTSTAGQFVGVDGPTVRVLALGAMRPTPHFVVTANLGAIIRAMSTYRNDPAVPSGAIEISQGSGFAWALGASVAATPWLRIGAEIFGERVSSSALMSGPQPIEALAGARIAFAGGWLLGIAAGRGVTSALGTPDARAIVEVGFAPGLAKRPRAVEHTAPVEPDRDHDGIPDSRDKCPDAAEDLDAFQDEDGCPDLDDDFDGIPDTNDKCPDEPETWNGIEDADGCPDSAPAATASAQTPAEVATTAFKQGRELMRDHKYAEACVAFEHSLRLEPAFGTRANLATCYVEIGKLATAWTMFRELASSDPNLDRRKLVAGIGQRLASRVPKLELALGETPTGFRVVVNGVDDTALVGVETPVDFGTYEIVATAPGFKPWTHKIVVRDEGQVTRVGITLERTR